MNSNQNLLRLLSFELKKISTFKPIGSLKKNKISINYIRITKKLDKNKDKKILIIRSGGIGDVLMTIPAIKSLRLKYPKANISFLTYDNNVSFLKKINLIDSVYDVKNVLKENFFLSKHYDLVVNLDNSILSSLIVKIVSSKDKKGLIYKKKNTFETSTKSAIFLNKLYTNKSFRKKNKIHLSQIFCEIIGVKFVNINILSDIRNSSYKDILKIKFFFKNFDENKKIIAVHPGSNWNSKILNYKTYSKIINYLISKDCNIIILGGSKEIIIEKKISKLISNKKNYLSLVNKYQLDLLPLILKTIILLITNDTGTMHFTYFSNTKAVIFFGPTSPKESGSMYKNCINILSNKKSAPCFSYKCSCFKKNSSNKCIDTINIDKVLKLIYRQI